VQDTWRADNLVRTSARIRVAVVITAIAAGYIIAKDAPDIRAALWFGCAAGACALAAAGRGRTARIALTLALVLLAGGWFSHRIHSAARGGLTRMIAEIGGEALLVVEGVAQNDPRRTEPDRRDLGRFAFTQSSWYFDLRCTRAGGRPTSGILRVWVRGDRAPNVRAGDRISVTGMVRGLDAPLNPGEPDARLWGAQRRAAGSISLPGASLIEPATGTSRLSERAAAGWFAARGAMQRRAERVLGGIKDDRSRALAEALLVGTRDPALRDTRGAFQRIGLSHLLAISGFHLVVMAAAGLFVLRATGDRGWVEPALLGVLVLAYLMLVPARPPIVRAGVMLLVLLAVEASGRRYDRVAVLGWIAVVMLILRPMDVFALGFQLSFGITAALIWIGRTVHERVFPPPVVGMTWRRPRGVRHFLFGRFKMIIVASLIGWGIAAPIVAWRIGIVSPGAVLATLVVLPLVVALLWVGFVALVVGVIAPPLGEGVSGLLGAIAGAVINIVERMDAVPGSSFLVPPTSGLLAAFGVIVVIWWLTRGHLRNKTAWSLTAVAVAWIGLEWSCAQRTRPGVVLRIDTIAVGNGTCHIFRSGGDAILWDCGSLTMSSATRTIPRTLRKLGVRHIRDAVVTHANFDHFNGLLEIERRFGLDRVVLGLSTPARAQERPNGAAAALLEKLRTEGVELSIVGAGDSIPVGRATVRFLSPNGSDHYKHENDRSLVAIVSAPTRDGVVTVLMTGDIQADAMKALMTAGGEINADVLELPHHGSVHETAVSFFDSVDPSVVLQSTGPQRARDTRWTARRGGRAWYTTSDDGATWVRINDDGRIEHGSLR